MFDYLRVSSLKHLRFSRERHRWVGLSFVEMFIQILSRCLFVNWRLAFLEYGKVKGLEWILTGFHLIGKELVFHVGTL